MKVGDLVKLRSVKKIAPFTFHPEEIGVVLEIREPNVNFPVGHATVQYDHGRICCYWAELEVVSEKE